MFLKDLKFFPQIIDALNKASVQKLLIYVFAVLQLTIIITYKDEISLLFREREIKIDVVDVAASQERCYTLRQKYNAEAVMFYIYQPVGSNKTYKERAVFSNSLLYKPLQSMSTVNLFSRSSIINSLNDKEYCIITTTSGHVESYILHSYEMNYAIVTSIRGTESKELVGELIWVFKRKEPFTATELRKLVAESQIFSLLINKSL